MRNSGSIRTGRVLIVAPQPTFEVRGTPINVRQMCRVLIEAGHEVHLATFAAGAGGTVPGLHLHRVGLPGLRTISIGFSLGKALLDVRLAARVRRLMRSGRYQLVHAVEEAAALVVPLARRLGLATISDVDSDIYAQLRSHRSPLARLLAPAALALLCRAWRRSDAVITVCDRLTQRVRSCAPQTPIVEIPDMPLPECERSVRDQEVAALRSELGLERRRVVLYTGNLEVYQGVDLLVAATQRVCAELPEVVTLIVGGDRRRLGRMRARVAEQGLADHVRLIGPRPIEQMALYMAAADVLVSPRCQGENTPLKIYTYMQSGRPIVATRLPVHTQVLDDETAFLAPATPGGLAGALLRALRDPQAAARVGAAARRRVEQRFSPDEFARRLLELYDRLLRQRVPHGATEPLRPCPAAPVRTPVRSSSL